MKATNTIVENAKKYLKRKSFIIFWFWKKLLGIISDRDVFKEISPSINTLAEDARALETLKKKAHQIMSRNPITVDKDVQIEDAVHILLENDISCLPVISATRDIEGILTWKDILKYYVKRNNL